MLQVAGGTAVIMLIAALFCYGQWQKAEAVAVELRGQVETLVDVNEQNAVTIGGLQDHASRTAEIIEEMGERRAEIEQRAEGYLIQVNDLRLTEAQRALEEPFVRGNDATGRMRYQLLRFSGDPRQDLHDSGDTGTSDPG